MNDRDSYADGFILSDVTISRLASVFASAGYDTNIGVLSVRVEALLGLKFGYVGNITPDEPFEIEMDGFGVPIDDAERCCATVAELLRASGIRFEFVHIGSSGEDIMVYQYDTTGSQVGTTKRD